MVTIITVDKAREVTLMYKVVIIWDDDKREIYHANTYKDAKEIESNYRRIFGNQITYSYVERELI